MVPPLTTARIHLLRTTTLATKLDKHAPQQTRLRSNQIQTQDLNSLDPSAATTQLQISIGGSFAASSAFISSADSVKPNRSRSSLSKPRSCD